MRTLGLVVMTALLAAGCTSYSSTAEGLGDSVRSARTAQTLNPQASLRQGPPSGLDGQAAKAALDNYQRSFTTPTQQGNVLNIGVGGSDSK